MRLLALFALPKRGGRTLVLSIFLLSGVVSCPAQKVVFSGKNLVIERIFAEVEKQTGYSIQYSPYHFKKAPLVDLAFRDSVSLEPFLKAVFLGLKYTFHISGRFIRIDPPNPNGPLFANLEGKIINPEKEPLSGATVWGEDGVTTLSRTDGSFSLRVKGFRTKVTISYTGFERQHLTLSNKDTCHITLQTGEGLDEAQVEAYNTTTPRTAVGNLFTVTARDFEIQPVSSFPEALVGQAPGVNVQRKSGVLGSAFKVRLGGDHSMQAGNDPLYIVDGVPMATNNFIGVTGAGSAMGVDGASIYNGIPNSIIASLVVMKGAAATAIYGSRASNGVILITLKKGIPGKVRCTVDFHSGISKVVPVSPLLNTSQFLQLREEAVRNSGQRVDSTTVPELGWGSGYTDFQKKFMGNTALNRDMRVDLSGGGGRSFFYLSSNFHQQSTEFPGNTTDTRQYLYGHLQTRSADDKMRLGVSSLFSRETNHLPMEDPGFYVSLAPNVPAFSDSNGPVWRVGEFPIVNIPALVNKIYWSTIANRLLHVQLNYLLNHHLSLESSLGFYHIGSDERSQKTLAGQDPNQQPNAKSTETVNNYGSSILELLARYAREIGPGVLDVVWGGYREVQRRDSLDVTIDGYNNDLFLGTGTIAGGTEATVIKGGVDYRYAALFGRGKYILKDKYIVSGSMRRDGSSRFGPGNQFGTFWAIDGAWIFTEETFFRQLDWLRFGKLRASYGTTGNDQIGDYRFMQVYTPTDPSRGYQGQSGVVPSTLYNPQLRWELSRNYELGIDLEFLKGRLAFSVLASRSQSKDQLLVSGLASQAGEPGVLSNLPVKVLNEGLEFVVRVRNWNIGAVRWASTINLTLPRNRLASFPGMDSTSYGPVYMVGKSLSVRKGLHNTGVDPNTGLYTFQDVNKDGKLNIKDYLPTPSLDPRCYGGWSNSFTYKRFRLDLFLEFHSQNGLNPLVLLDWMNAPGMQAPSQLSNGPIEWLDHWRKPGDHSRRMRISAQRTPAEDKVFQNYLTSDASIIDASYWRLKTVSLSYQFDKETLKKLRLQSLQLYIRGQNILTRSHYHIADPETQNPSGLPPSKTLVAGFTFTL